MKKTLLATFGLLTFSLFAFGPATKLTSTKTHIRFFSHTPVEDIEAHNHQAIATLDLASGAMAFSVPMQAFQFEKALMQKHFNQPNFLDTKKHPKATFSGQIIDFPNIDLQKNGQYKVTVKGTMTLHGQTKEITEKGTLEVKGAEIHSHAKFNITLADYGVVFDKGKPASNIAKTVEVTTEAIFNK